MDLSDLETLMNDTYENDRPKPVQVTPNPLEYVVVGIFKAIAAFHDKEPNGKLFGSIMIDNYRTQRNLTYL